MLFELYLTSYSECLRNRPFFSGTNWTDITSISMMAYDSSVGVFVDVVVLQLDSPLVAVSGSSIFSSIISACLLVLGTNNYFIFFLNFIKILRKKMFENTTTILNYYNKTEKNQLTNRHQKNHLFINIYTQFEFSYRILRNYIK